MKQTSEDITLPPGVPAYVDRKTAAELVTQHFYPLKARTMPELPLPWKVVNKRAVVSTRDLFAFAKAKLDAAPLIQGGRRRRVAA